MKKIAILCLLLSASRLYAQNFNFTMRSQFPFFDEKIAGIWGYEKDGREYALVAGTENMHIVEVTNPDAPSLVVSLPMAADWGKEVRTYQHFAFVSAEAGPGLVIYDLSKLPSTNTADYPKKEISQYGSHNLQVHTLHIDVTTGTLYLNGTWYGTLIYNLLPNPFSPSFAGIYDKFNGIHDGYADNDTLFAAHISEGFVAVVNMHDKLNPVILSTFETPGKFPHNTWLTHDRHHLLAADEIRNGFVSIWDVSNLDNIREVSRFRSTPGSGSVPHNAFILKDYAFVSWYRDGVVLLDLTRPENAIQVGRFDTSPLYGFNYNGSWGNYPYLPSGNVLVSDIEQGLFVFTPIYTRACYLEGNVKDAVTKDPLTGVKVFILKGDQTEPSLTSVQGAYRTGQSKAGEFEVVFAKDGYRPLLRNVELKPGEVTLLEAEISPLTVPGDDKSILFLAAENNQPLVNLEAVFRSEIFQFQVKTDSKGWAKVPIVYTDSFDVFPAMWGRLPLKGVEISPAKPPVIRLERGYYDDFGFDLGWKSEGNAEKGFWEKGILPEGVLSFTSVKGDMPGDLGDKFYTTGFPTEIRNYDVINGTVRLISPDIDLKDYQNPVLNFQYWLVKVPVTPMEFSVFLENESDKKKIWSSTGYSSNWTYSGDLVLSNEPLSGVWKIVFEATDTLDGGFECCLFEAGLDVVQIREDQSSSFLPIETLQVEVFPNPFHNQLNVRCLLPEGDLPAQWQLFDVAGREVLSGKIDAEAVALELSLELASGIYFFRIQQDGGKGKTIKVVKL